MTSENGNTADISRLKVDDVLYRIEGYISASGWLDECGEYHSAPTRPDNYHLAVVEYRIVRVTPFGYRIHIGDGLDDRFVRTEQWTGKKFAHVTIAEAYQSFVHRKKRQQAILQKQLDDSKQHELLAHACLKALANGAEVPYSLAEAQRYKLLPLD